MNRKPLLLCICFGLLTVAACGPDKTINSTVSVPKRITQVSVISALMVGRFDGVMPIPELLRHGDFGVGTLDHLDGELIILEGRAYQIRGDGVVNEVGPNRSTPFAVITPFESDGEFACPNVSSLEALDSSLDKSLSQENNFVAIRIDGRFDSLTLRSVHRQETPFRKLAEVAKSQSVWTHQNVSGTLVGVRCPPWVGGLNVPGYHWHFLANDRKIGGHVLDCRIREGKGSYSVCRDWIVKLESSAEFNGTDLNQDLSADLHKVESSRGASNAANEVPSKKAAKP